MTGGQQLIDIVEIDLRHDTLDQKKTVYINIFDNSLSRRWLQALDDVLEKRLLLEKNYCFLGFADSARDGDLICSEINKSISAINHAQLGYFIDDEFTMDNCLDVGPIGDWLPGLRLKKDKFNRLHRYFEDLQGVSGDIKEYYHRADATARWHIRQLNLLCHEFESWALSNRKKHYVPDWQRPSQLMCWLNAPRFSLEPQDLELFGVDTIARPMGAVYVGVNKAVGKHHWEVYKDEGRDSRIGELVTSTLRSQTEAAADFDIEWAQDTTRHPWMQQDLQQFREWLMANGFDPHDPNLTIGHPQIGQVDIIRTFGGDKHTDVWCGLEGYLDVTAVRTGRREAEYLYRWSDTDYIDIMTKELT